MPAGSDWLTPQVLSVLQTAIGLFGSAGVAAFMIGRMTHKREVKKNAEESWRLLNDESREERLLLVKERDYAREWGYRMEKERDAAKHHSDGLMDSLRALYDYLHKLVHQANGRLQAGIISARLLESGLTHTPDGLEIALPEPIPSPPKLESFLPARKDSPS